MFLSRRYRPNMWPFYGLIGVEFCLTVGLLALTGIAAPNTYRKSLWQDGADNGFNSSPLAGLYAAANYRSYTTPKVWSQFITNYNLVMAVLSMFFMLIKSIMYMLHVFPPIISAILHAVLLALYSVSVYYQASPDNSDPAHPSNGPVWYISKSCSVASNKGNIGYCQQAKATFACFCAMLGIFGIYFILSVWSCIPSKTQRENYHAKKEAKKLRWAHLDELENDKQPQSATWETPDTPGFQQGMHPATPRTMAFNSSGANRDLPLREVVASPVSPQSVATQGLRSPGILRTPMSFKFGGTSKSEKMPEERAVSPDPSGMYFPPPPKQSTKK